MRLHSASLQMKKSRQQKNTTQIPMSPSSATIGDVVRNEFLKPRGITRGQLLAGIPKGKPRSVFLREYVSWMLDPGFEESVGADQLLFVDVSLVLDRAFSCPQGYFIKRWASCAVRSCAEKNNVWLSKIPQVGKFGEPSESTKRSLAIERWMIDAVNEIDRAFGLPRFDSAIQDVATIIAQHYWRGENQC
jgi:hypothetical protein